MSHITGEVIYVQQHEDEEKYGVTLSAKTPVFSLKKKKKSKKTSLADGLSFAVIRKDISGTEIWHKSVVK